MPFSSLFSYPQIPKVAKESFRLFHIRSDKVMIALLLLQWFISSFVTSMAYDTYKYGFFSGALITLPIVFLYPYLKGDKYYRYLIAIAMMLFSVVFIQQYLGRIELHFHVFIAMAILTIYKDVIPLIIAAVVTILHHIIFNYLQFYEVSFFDMPVMIFNYGCGFDIVVLHAVFVISELLVLGYIIKMQIEQNIDLTLTQSQIVSLNKTLEHSSLHDNLTGLPNRLYLRKEISKIKKYAKDRGEKFAIVFLDLDHFKNINDTLGHDIGDLLLKTVANVLKDSVPANSIISRIGGDEFIIVISQFKDDHKLLPVINDLQTEFKKELLVKGYSLRLSASIGISIFPNDSTRVRELMKYADIAMYNAKSSGRDNFSFFTQDLNKQIHNEVDIINDMQRAFYDNEFKLYYQPKIDLKSKKIIGAEALLRWQHFEKGLISPVIFIPLAENTGFILNLGKFVIEQSTKAIKRFNDLGYKDMVISINVSTRQFQNSDLYKELKDEILKNGIDAKQLSIEITESIMMKYIDKTLDTLNRIKDLGISIYIDDFGMAYSSLSYLKKFPIDILKIDKSFVDDISESSNNENLLIDTILAMSKSLGLKVIAEGVETEFQYRYLKERDYDMMQGYYFAKPMSEDDFIELLDKDSK